MTPVPTNEHEAVKGLLQRTQQPQPRNGVLQIWRVIIAVVTAAAAVLAGWWALESRVENVVTHHNSNAVSHPDLRKQIDKEHREAREERRAILRAIRRLSK